MSLKAQNNRLADAHVQVDIIQQGQSNDYRLSPFQQKLEQNGLYPLKPTQIEILQVNVGKMCNQACRHCHVDAGPDRKEIMTRETMQQCISVLRAHPQLKIADITGGAPELNPNFRWFVEELHSMNKHVMVRCNLTILLANKKYHDLPGFYKMNQVEVISSLPFYSKDRTDRQRGEGVFQDSIKALQMLNAAGYGMEGTGLLLNLVYNPAGAFLPPSQQSLEKEFRHALMRQHGISFNHLYTITNMPISRYLDFLLESGNFDSYMQKLAEAYNPATAANVMCRNTLSVGWDGYLYDCDFNQMLELKVNCSGRHIRDFNHADLLDREIVVGQHCYGCTAGSGSSCGGAITQ